MAANDESSDSGDSTTKRRNAREAWPLTRALARAAKFRDSLDMWRVRADYSRSVKDIATLNADFVAASDDRSRAVWDIARRFAYRNPIDDGRVMSAPIDAYVPAGASDLECHIIASGAADLFPQIIQEFSARIPPDSPVVFLCGGRTRWSPMYLVDPPRDCRLYGIGRLMDPNEPFVVQPSDPDEPLRMRWAHKWFASAMEAGDAEELYGCTLISLTPAGERLYDPEFRESVAPIRYLVGRLQPRLILAADLIYQANLPHSPDAEFLFSPIPMVVPKHTQAQREYLGLGRPEALSNRYKTSTAVFGVGVDSIHPSITMTIHGVVQAVRVERGPTPIPLYETFLNPEPILSEMPGTE